MEKEFIPYEQALALKELGFDEKCLSYPTSNTDASGRTWTSVINAPLYQQAFRWFRERYGLDGKPEYFLNDWYCFIVNDMKEEDTSRRLFTEFPSYEETELECLKKLIEIVKDEKRKEIN